MSELTVSPADHELRAEQAIDVSVVLPCLNEEATVARCVAQALRSLESRGYHSEIVVSDNGSTDASVQRASHAGARVVSCPQKGYGAALRYGISRARGRYIVMADADDSYDLSQAPDFVEALEAGADFVIGNRFAGGIGRGAMPWKNRYIGNPLLTGVLNLLYRANVGDAHCGIRSFTSEAFLAMQTRCHGMEFASELLVRATQRRLKIIEIPTTLRPDGRHGPPHLAPFRDGWRHLWFLLTHAPSRAGALTGLMLCAASCAALLVVGGQIRLSGTRPGPLSQVLGLVVTSSIVCGLCTALTIAAQTWRARQRRPSEGLVKQSATV